MDFEMCQGAEYTLTRAKRRLRVHTNIDFFLVILVVYYFSQQFSISLRISDKTSYNSIEDDQLTQKGGQSRQIWQIRTREGAEKN